MGTVLYALSKAEHLTTAHANGGAQTAVGWICLIGGPSKFFLLIFKP